MSTFNMIKDTSSKIKDTSLALVLIASLVGATVSTSANASPAPSVEHAVSEFVVTQGQKMINELNVQLQQSIEHQINAFSANFSLNSAATWLAAEQEVTPAVNAQSKLASKDTNNSL